MKVSQVGFSSPGLVNKNPQIISNKKTDRTNLQKTDTVCFKRSGTIFKKGEAPMSMLLRLARKELPEKLVSKFNVITRNIKTSRGKISIHALHFKDHAVFRDTVKYIQKNKKDYILTFI